MTDDSSFDAPAGGDGPPSHPVRTDGGRDDDEADDRYEHAPAVEYDAVQETAKSDEQETADTGRSTSSSDSDRVGSPAETTPSEPHAESDDDAGATADERPVATAADVGPTGDHTRQEVAAGIVAVYGAVTAGLALVALALSGFDVRALTAFGTGFGFVSAEATMHAVAPTAIVLAVLAGGYAARCLDDRAATTAAAGGAFAGGVVLAIAVAVAVWLPARGLDIGVTGLLGGAAGVGVAAAVVAALVVRAVGRFLTVSPSVRVVAASDEDENERDAPERGR